MKFKESKGTKVVESIPRLQLFNNCYKRRLHKRTTEALRLENDKKNPTRGKHATSFSIQNNAALLSIK